MPFFEITKRSDCYVWDFLQGTPNNPGASVAISADDYETESQARSGVAAAKKLMSGARMAKVVTAGG